MSSQCSGKASNWRAHSVVCIIFCTFISIEEHVIHATARNERKRINHTSLNFPVAACHWNQHDSGQTHPFDVIIHSTLNHWILSHFSFFSVCFFFLVQPQFLQDGHLDQSRYEFRVWWENFPLIFLSLAKEKILEN